MLVFAVPHIDGQHRQCVLTGYATGFGVVERIDCERMTQGMGIWPREDGVSDNPPGLIEAHPLNTLMKDESNAAVAQISLFPSGKKIWVSVLLKQDAAYAKIVFDVSGKLFGDRDQPVLFKFGFFNVNRFVVGPVVSF